ncbi:MULTISPECIES: response regulator [Nostoc]|uniref:Response regulator n=1 Tax=Nostoc paludosum FACHB-159 TaxID=2692908 RepID=A0ABR8K8B8_9NOSO|nr:MULTISPECIES: response regulator [Nostoc]MBD2679480.1 response regulator [Nostoc sp. FACHB-857]MBD2735739.1 response regulator [Nostoc paludosum FACHB-159]
MNTEQQTILLAEDDSNQVLLIRRALHKANLMQPLQVVSNGEAAISYLCGEGEYADRERYPLPILFLLDLKMPRKSGFEVLEWLKQQPELKRLPVIVLTTSKETTDVHKAYDLGVNSYLVKPVAFNDLTAMIKLVDAYWLNLNQQPLVYLS